MNIQDNHFAFFGLTERFGLDADALDRAYREVQMRVHPDRFAGSGATEQRIALQWATRANEAYRVLRDPLQRAIYLCSLRGENPADENNTKMPQAFLVRQLAWREALDEARDAGGTAAIDELRGELDTTLSSLRQAVAHALDDDGDISLAVDSVRQWMFVERFGEDVRTGPQRAGVH